jgi:hypothetical protein
MVTVGSILSGTFGFVRDNVRAILVWSGILFLASLISLPVMQPMYAEQLAAVQPGVLAAPHMGVFGLLVPIFLLAFVVLWAAAYRAVLFPEQQRFFYLRVGMDELRLLGTMLILVVGGIVLTLLFGLVLGLVVGLIAMILGAAGSALISFLTFVLLVGGWIFLGVRLSLAGPLTILQHKVIIGPSWRATRGNFWRLFAAYLVIILLLTVVYGVVALVQMGSILPDMMRPTDPAAHARVLAWQAAHYSLSVSGLIAAVVGSIIGGVAVALQAGGTAVATAQLLDRRGEQHLSEVFE